ncbi:MAG: DUF4178 domain-containing protein [Chloroflexi bacterium]|nr:DUF4178 domain-containing protein [Chloroflexota bacterium]
MSWRKFFGMEKEPEKIEERTPQTLQVGDVVSYHDEDYFVEQRIEYHGDGGDVWWDFLLVNPQDKYWLGVVEDEGLALTLYHDVPFHPHMPPSDPLSYQEEEYHRTEYGFANAILKKKSKLSTTERVEYWDYESESGKQLSIERWGDNEVREDQSQMTGTIHCSIGETIKPYQITIYPGNPEG